MKKITKNILILSTLIISSIISWTYYTKKTNDLPVTTGGDAPVEVPENINEEPNAMERLSKELPLKTTGILIEYSFKKGKYIVTSSGSNSIQTDFDRWYESSDYQAIPKSRFLIIR